MNKLWTHEDKLYGCTIRACFFNNEQSDSKTDFVERVFPMLQNKDSLKVLYSEEDRKNFKHGKVCAQPDAVLEQHTHLLSLEYKSVNNRKHYAKSWKEQIRVKDILQCIINAIQVSRVEQKVTVPLLRYNNVLYMIVPDEQLCDMIYDAANIKGAMLYHEEKYNISASCLSSFLENKVKNKYQTETAASILGKEKHDKLLKKNENQVVD